MNKIVLRVGDLAIADAHYLIPCKVVAITGTSGPAGTQQMVTVKLTAARGAWKRGELIQFFGHRVVPRAAVRYRKYRTYFLAYDVEVEPEIYCTSYCNHGHRLIDGKPVDHECYILPPEALRLEREGKFEEAIAAIVKAKPLRTHKGVKP